MKYFYTFPPIVIYFKLKHINICFSIASHLNIMIICASLVPQSEILRGGGTTRGQEEQRSRQLRLPLHAAGQEDLQRGEGQGDGHLDQHQHPQTGGHRR